VSSREYDREVSVGSQTTVINKRVWEVRVDLILKLDRAAKADTSQDEAPQ
jgi:hypothetical protein